MLTNKKESACNQNVVLVANAGRHITGIIKRDFHVTSSSF